MEQIANATNITFYPLVFCDEDDGEVTIGRLDNDSYALFPADGAALLQQLRAGLSPQQAHDWYMQHFGEAVDIQDFLSNLKELGFIRNTTEDDEAVSSSHGEILYWLGNLAFSPYAYFMYIVLFCIALYKILQFPVLLPGYQNLFFSPYFVLLEVGLFLGQLPGIFIHEFYHVLAGRRLGIPARLGIGYRLYFLVFETTLTGLWVVPQRSRYLPFLAGMLADTLWFSLLTLLAGMTIDDTGKVSAVGMFCLALAYSTLLRFLWQFYFYLRTDLYYVFTHVCGCIDLLHTTQCYLRNLFWRTVRRFDKIEDEASWYAKDRLVARWYAPIYILGNLFSLSVFALVGIPTLLRTASGIIAHLHSGPAYANTFWDACLFLAGTLVQLVLVAILLLRNRTQKWSFGSFKLHRKSR